MSYLAEISRTNPTCFIFLVDQSKSMDEPFGAGTGQSRAQGVADAINRFLQNLAIKCAKADGIRDYFHIGVIGYGNEVASAWGGVLSRKQLVPISTVANNPLRVENRTRQIPDGKGGHLEQKFKFPVWIEPFAGGKTPMSRALEVAMEYLELFISLHPFSYPPMVVNLTDGLPSDSDPRPHAEAIREMTTSDGNVLLFNAHLSGLVEQPVHYPSDESGLSDTCAKLLFRMSSVLPSKFVDAARGESFNVTDESRGFVFNADVTSLVRFIDLGTRPFVPSARQ